MTPTRRSPAPTPRTLAQAARCPKPAIPQENLADLFLGLWRMLAPGVPPPVREYRFHRYRFDCALPSAKVYIELDGWGHKTDDRWRSDILKFNLATSEGWRGFHFTRRMLKDDPTACIEMVIRAVKETNK